MRIDFTALCTRAQAEILVPYDHHRVRIGNQWAILLTYHWYPFEDGGPYTAHFVAQYAMQHPEAPPEIQAVINELRFHPKSSDTKGGGGEHGDEQ